MSKKIVAVGNMIMCDDGVCIKLAEFLNNDFRMLGFETILGETDVDYCIDQIEDGDFIVILDSSYYDIEPGTITLTNINDIDITKIHISQHGLNLLELLNLNNTKVCGFLLTIEISQIYFNPDLSPVLKSKFHNICDQCIQIIKKIGEGNSF